MEAIIRFFHKRPLLVRLLLVFIVVISAASLMRIKRLAMPSVDMRLVEITTVYPGASPEDVEVNVTIKLEDALRQVEGIKTFSSKSIENISIITAELDSDSYDIEKTKTDIRRAVDSITDLPDAVTEKPSVFEHKMDNYPVFVFSLTHDTNDREKLLFHAKNIRKKLLELNTVSSVSFSGIPKKEIRILLNRAKMEDKYISFNEVISAIENNNLKVSGGSLESYTKEKSIVTFSEFNDPEDIENIIVRAGETGNNQIRIRDIGRVEWGFEKEQTIGRFNSREGVSIDVAKKPNADIIGSIDGQIKPLLEKYMKDYSADGIGMSVLDDDSLETKQRLSIVYSNAVVGFFLVVLILFLFLDRTIAVWTAFGIPVSIALTLIALPLFGVTINSISLCGLVVVLGMVVDDAIIISESIYLEKQKGLTSLEASVTGLKNVIFPVMGTIITTMIAFAPMYFIPGMVGDFSMEIPTIVIIMLAASFIEATMLLPVHLAKSKSDILTHKAPPGQKLIHGLENIYMKFLSSALRHKFKSLVLFFVVLIAGCVFSAFYLTKHFNMFPVAQAYKMYIFGKTPEGSNLHYTSEQLKKIESIINLAPEGTVKSYSTVVGQDFMDRIKASNLFSIEMILTPALSRTMTAEDVKTWLSGEFSKADISGIEDIKFFIDGGGPPVGKPLELRLIGNDNAQREILIKDISEYLESIGVIDIEANIRSGKDELRLIPDYTNIARANLSVAQIASTIRTAIDGSIVTYLNTPEERIPFRVILDEKSQNYENPVQGLTVSNNLGRLVPLENLVVQKKGKAPSNIYHFKGDRVNIIYGSIDRNKTTAAEIYTLLNEKYADFEMQHPGFRLDVGGEAKESSRVMIQMIIAVLIAVLAVYFILVIQFNSFLQPGIVILSIPFGIIGICAAFFLHGQDLSMMATIGILGFAGVVVNDSLIMVEFINRLLRDNPDADRKQIIEFIKEGAKIRLRPILLTTITTVAGLAPTAYGLIGSFDFFISPMVLAMGWGLISGTIATLMIIPVFYIHIYGISVFFKKLLRLT